MLGFKKNNTGTDGDAIVREIAERCAAATLSQLSTATAQMSIAQLRGYVRAHAWSQVWAEVQCAVTNGQLNKAQVSDLAGRTLEQTVHLVASTHLTAPVMVMPAPHIARRAA